MATSLISLGQVIDKTFAHYKTHFLELLSITAWIIVAAIPVAIAKLLEPYVVGTEPTPFHIFTIALNDLGALLVGIVSAWAFITVIIAVSEEAHGVPPDAKARARKGWKLFFSYLWVSILLSLVIAVILVPPVLGVIFIIIDFARGQSTVLSSIGGVLLLVGSLISFVLLVKYSISYGFAPYALILEDQRGMKALTSSAALVSGRWWATFLRFVFPKLLYSMVIVALNFVVLAAIAIILVIVFGQTPLMLGLGSASWFLSTTILTALTIPLIAVTDYHIYDSLRSPRT